jgi:hypothetical protein
MYYYLYIYLICFTQYKRNQNFQFCFVSWFSKTGGVRTKRINPEEPPRLHCSWPGRSKKLLRNKIVYNKKTQKMNKNVINTYRK